MLEIKLILDSDLQAQRACRSSGPGANPLETPPGLTTRSNDLDALQLQDAQSALSVILSSG